MEQSISFNVRKGNGRRHSSLCAFSFQLLDILWQTTEVDLIQSEVHVAVHVVDVSILYVLSTQKG